MSASVSETSTAPAPTSAAPETGIRQRISRTPERRSPSGSRTTSPQPGETLKAEALNLLTAHNWRQACRLAETAKRLRPDDIELDAIIAMATAQRRWKRLTGFARENLDRQLESATSPDGRALSTREQALGWTAMSSVLLAERHYVAADSAARRAIELAPTAPAGWWQLAASYSGLGWFDEAETCINRARIINRTNSIGTNSIGTSTANTPPLAGWQIGRAVNQWAMTNSSATLIAIIGFVFFGLIGLAVAITVPFISRELRVANLTGEPKVLADGVWVHDHKRRLIAAAGVFALVVLWTITLTLPS